MSFHRRHAIALHVHPSLLAHIYPSPLNPMALAIFYVYSWHTMPQLQLVAGLRYDFFLGIAPVNVLFVNLSAEFNSFTNTSLTYNNVLSDQGNIIPQ